MSEYRRYLVPGATYFFTAVTDHRAKLFSADAARRCLGSVFRQCRCRHPFEVIAIVLLPDHLHTIWSLPAGDDDYSLRWRWINREFTRAWLLSGGREQPRTHSSLREQRRGI